MDLAKRAKKIISFFTNRTNSLATRFLMMMNIVIFITVFLMASYYAIVSQRLSEISQSEKSFTNKAVSNLVFETARLDIEHKDYTRLNKITRSLIQNNLISYATIYELNSNKTIIWTTMPGLKGDYIPPHLLNEYYLRSISNIKADPENFKMVGGKIKNYFIVVGYKTEPVLVSYIKTVLNNNKILALSFLFLGVICAILMTRVVTGPLNRLKVGADILSQGNLKHKIPDTQYREVNVLVDAFNKMAQKLDEVYTSLEDKVKDRTKEVVDKNNELQKAYQELQEAQSLVVHSEKMRSLGELVAGITHEINNPVNFIYGNLIHLNNYSKDLVDIIEKYQEVESKLPEEDRILVKNLKNELEYDFIKEDLPDLIKSCKEGTERTKNIILDLKSFSRADEMIINEINVHKEIDTALNILYNKYKDKVTIHKEYGNIPAIDCYGGQINQVFLNILDNAIFAIDSQGDIFIRTTSDNNFISIEIEDSGRGMSKENVKKVFEPFYTTKAVGEGTGLGMSISYKVVQNHNGTIEVESEIGKGTKFTVKLPVEGVKKESKVEG